MGDAAEGVQQGAEVRGHADRVAGHESAAVDDAIGEERAAARGEEVALVATEREEREAVVSVLADEPLGLQALRRRLANAERERAEPQVERTGAEREREQAERLLDAIGEDHPVGRAQGAE